MRFKVLLHPKAARSLKKLGPVVRERVEYRLRKLDEKPEEVGEKLKYSRFWKLRVGDYRAIYEIDYDKKQVIVLFVDHRDNVYDNFSHLIFWLIF